MALTIERLLLARVLLFISQFLDQLEIACGKKTRKRAPLPGLQSRRIVPRWSSTILATIESPSPTPSFFEVKNGLNICSRNSGGTPAPESSTVTQTPGVPLEASGAINRRKVPCGVLSGVSPDPSAFSSIA